MFVLNTVYIYDLVCDVISCCVQSCGMGKVNVYDIVMMENKKKKEKI